MQQYFFLDNSRELQTSIQLQGDFVIAYSLRLWKSDDKVLELVEDIRGSCFNKKSKTICYHLTSIQDDDFSYLLELDANISTINSDAHYGIKLSVEQKLDNGKFERLGMEQNSGKVSCSQGGVFSKLGISLFANTANKLAS